MEGADDTRDTIHHGRVDAPTDALGGPVPGGSVESPKSGGKFRGGQSVVSLGRRRDCAPRTSGGMRAAVGAGGVGGAEPLGHTRHYATGLTEWLEPIERVEHLLRRRHDVADQAFVHLKDATILRGV